MDVKLFVLVVREGFRCSSRFLVYVVEFSNIFPQRCRRNPSLNMYTFGFSKYQNMMKQT